MKVYVAFSIHGTNCFITATKEFSSFDQLPISMTVVKSRNPDATDTKVHWNRLLTKKGEPLRSPPMIVKKFNSLQQYGWKIDKAAFVAKHWKKKQK